MSHNDRLRESLKITSPEGNEFEMLWVSDTRSAAKRVGRYAIVGLDGLYTQDYGIGAWEFATTTIIDGDDHDLTAKALEWAMYERGQWGMIHPVDDFLSVQPVDIAFDRDPVNANGVTKVTISWIEPSNPEVDWTDSEAAADVKASTEALADAQGQSWADKISAGSQRLRATVTEAVGKVAGIADQVLGPIATAQDAVVDTYSEIQSSLQGLLESVVLQPIQIANGFQLMAELPGRSVNDLQSRVRAYRSMSTFLRTDLDDKLNSPASFIDDALLNDVLTNELAQASVVAGLAYTLVTSDYKGRPEAIDALNILTEAYDEIVASLDAAQEAFEGRTLGDRYLTFGDTYSLVNRCVYGTVQYLLLHLKALKVRRTIVTTEAIPSIIACERLYGGISDEIYSAFVRENRLTTDEILLLPAGRELVAYA